MLGIYVHIPFCEKKCNYCSFSSFSKDEDFIKKYINFLCSEIKSSKFKGREIDSIYIGGGTPSLLMPIQIDSIFKSIYKTFKVNEQCEITIECNPNSITYDKVLAYKKNNVNRISLGVQSLNEGELQFLGRKHNVKQVFNALANIQKVGIENISADLLIGIGGSNFASFKRQLDKLLGYKVKHISCYMLQVEENTPLDKMYQKDKNILLNDEDCTALYKQISNYLKSKNFNHYEISNFALKGFESKHNMKYWTGEEYIGFGLAAHSYINKTRFANCKSFDKYYSGELEFCEKLTLKELIEEHIMLGLRCQSGINKNYLKSLGYDIEKNQNYQKLLKNKIIFDKKNKVILNEEYFTISNNIILELID